MNSLSNFLVPRVSCCLSTYHPGLARRCRWNGSCVNSTCNVRKNVSAPENTERKPAKTSQINGKCVMQKQNSEQDCNGEMLQNIRIEWQHWHGGKDLTYALREWTGISQGVTSARKTYVGLSSCKVLVTFVQPQCKLECVYKFLLNPLQCKRSKIAIQLFLCPNVRTDGRTERQRMWKLFLQTFLTNASKKSAWIIMF